MKRFTAGVVARVGHMMARLLISLFSISPHCIHSIFSLSPGEDLDLAAGSLLAFVFDQRRVDARPAPQSKMRGNLCFCLTACPPIRRLDNILFELLWRRVYFPTICCLCIAYAFSFLKSKRSKREYDIKMGGSLLSHAKCKCTPH
jgi:hypothetical protein